MSKILMLTTGGTIAGNVAGGASELTGLDLKDQAVRAFERMRDEWNLDVEVEVDAVTNIDSSDLEASLWTQLATKIATAYDDYDAFVITHGTNTMGYTTAALSFAFENLGKAIAVTGSQVPGHYPSSDALLNVENAIRITMYPHEAIRGVVGVFGSHLISGTRVKKRTEFDLDAFASFASGSLGRFGRILQLDRAAVARHNQYWGASGARNFTQLKWKAEFDVSGIVSITEFPSLSCDDLIAMAQNWKGDGRGLRGVIWRAYGAGDVQRKLWPFFDFLKEKTIPAVVTTQAPMGQATFDVNDNGAHFAAENLAVAANDMSIEAMTTKLAWLLAQDLSYETRISMLGQNLRGEISAHESEIW